MKLTKIVASLPAAIAAMSFLACCSSDPNPIGYLNAKDARTFVEIDLSVTPTRAEVAATGFESAISKVFIYIFDSNGDLEGTPIEVEEISNSKVVVGTTPGKKTIYAITAKDVIAASSIEASTLDEFESAVINSQASNLYTATYSGTTSTYSDFVMVGKADVESLAVTKSQLNIPASNKIQIDLEHLVAKIQVQYSPTISGTEIGIKEIIAGTMNFKVYQTANNMRLVSTGTAIVTDFTDENTDGTYDNYTYDDGRIETSASTTPGFQYAPENIVDDPVSGNTTFITVKLQCTPNKVTDIDGGGIWHENEYARNADFLTIGIYDENNDSFIDFVRKGNGIIYFENEDDSQKYKQLYPASQGLKYKIFTYKRGTVYYRLNISEGEGDNKKYQVKRNKCYNFTINTLSELGMPGIEYLIPSDASTPLKGTEAEASWMESTLNVTSWSGENSDVDLK